MTARIKWAAAPLLLATLLLASCGRGHGVFASAPARFTMISFEVLR